MRYSARILALLTVAIILYSGIGVVAAQQDGRSTDHSALKQGSSEPTPPYHKNAEDAKPLPSLLPASNFSDRPLVARAYEIAHQIPLVLAQQPCYCNCDKAFGHSSLLDCFTSSHTAGCGICIGETFFAFQMTQQGKTPAEIRGAIIRGDWKRPAGNKSSN
jgi:hypothetical protein